MGQQQRVVGYIRVSSDKQVDHGIGLDVQQEKIRQYVALYDLTLVDILVDAGESAKTLKRPGLQQALSMLTSGKADALLVTKLDRLTRRVQDLGTLIEDYFEQRYALMSVTDQIDIRTANGRLVLNILMSFSQWEREAIQERTREAMAYRRQNGERTGGDVPYGYRAINGKLVQDPDEQAMLALIHRYRVQGLSIRAIVAELDRLGHRTRKGTPFQPTQIVRMLKHQEGA